jgi:hypothetical protein
MTVISGPSNFIHLRKGDKNVYVIYDVHSNGGNREKCAHGTAPIDILKWIKRDFLPKYTREKKLDVFVEQSIFLEEHDNYPNPSSLDKMRQFISKCESDVTRCHSIDIRSYLCASPGLYMNTLELFYNGYFPILQVAMNSNDEVIKKKYTEDLVMIVKSLIKMIEGMSFDLSYMISFSKKHMTPGLLQHHIFQKTYDKLNDDDKKFYIDLCNQTRTLIIKFYQECDEFYARVIKNPFNERIEDITKLRDDFDLKNTIPKFRNFYEMVDVFISATARLLDVYVIGRLLKPYIKDCLVYVGAAHGVNITRQLMTHGYKIIYKANDITYPRWSDTKNEHVHCMTVDDIWMKS